MSDETNQQSKFDTVKVSHYYILTFLDVRSNEHDAVRDEVKEVLSTWFDHIDIDESGVLLNLRIKFSGGLTMREMLRMFDAVRHWAHEYDAILEIWENEDDEESLCRFSQNNIASEYVIKYIRALRSQHNI